jgi:hypothetical protein
LNDLLFGYGFLSEKPNRIGARNLINVVQNHGLTHKGHRTSKEGDENNHQNGEQEDKFNCHAAIIAPRKTLNPFLRI